MKVTALPLVLGFVVLGCGTQSDHRPAAAEASPIGSRIPAPELRALSLAKAYAQDRRWNVYRFPTRGRLDDREWCFAFLLWNRDFLGNYSVYVNDATGEVRHVRGE